MVVMVAVVEDIVVGMVPQWLPLEFAPFSSYYVVRTCRFMDTDESTKRLSCATWMVVAVAVALYSILNCTLSRAVTNQKYYIHVWVILKQ